MAPHCQGPQDGIQHHVQALAEVFGEKAEDEAAVGLQGGVFATVAPPCLGIGEMLTAINLDDEAAARAEKIDLHLSAIIEGNGKHGIEMKPSGKLRRRFQPAKEERLAGAPGARGAFGVRRRSPGRVDEQFRQRLIDTVAD